LINNSERTRRITEHGYERIRRAENSEKLLVLINTNTQEIK